VLWLLALLSILLGAFALLAHTEHLQSRHLFDATRARYAAEAGINLAVYRLMMVDPEARWIPDGREYDVRFDDADVQMSITDESGKLDVNVADAETLDRLLQSVGVDADQSIHLADAILDWRDPDDLLQPNGAEEDDYEAAGLPYGPGNRPFSTIGEVQQVLGMTPEIFQAIEPALTVYSGQGRPNASFAPLEALRALPDMDDTTARELIDLRHQMDSSGNGPTLTLPNGQPVMVRGGTGTYSIEARATLPNGAWTRLLATVRIGSADASESAYTVLRWEDGEAL